MKKLIRLPENEYVIINDSKIKKGDLIIDIRPDRIDKDDIYRADHSKDCGKKITHSSIQLEKDGFDKIKQLNSDYIKVYLENYDVIKFRNESINDLKITKFNTDRERLIAKMFYARGFNKHKELIQQNYIFAHQKTEWDIELRDEDTIELV